jgi:hypothetical protein
MKIKTLFASVAAMLTCSALYGQVWNEIGDAGSAGIGAAQVVSGSGSLTAISGEIVAGGGDEADVFLIEISDFANFSASTVGGAGYDTQLFLFNADGSGQVHNDDFGGLQSTITSQGVFANGTYALAVTAFNSDPLDAGAAAVFGFATWPGPDAQQRMPASANPFVSWTGASAGGTYRISLTGASFVNVVPEPGSAMALIGLGLVGFARGRRR